MKTSVKRSIKELGLPTTGTYHGYKIGNTIYGKKIVAWWKPHNALLEDGSIFYIRKKLPRNPGTKWHVDKKLFYYDLKDKARTKKERELYAARAGEHEFSAYTSRRLGINPTRKRRKVTSKGLLPVLIIGAIVTAIYYGRR